MSNLAEHAAAERAATEQCWRAVVRCGGWLTAGCWLGEDSRALRRRAETGSAGSRAGEPLPRREREGWHVAAADI
jgi:uncharacterized membrane protein